MGLTLHQLKVFAAVAQAGGITHAAKKLHMTQPAVSIQIKQLEQHLGLSLIEVIGKKIYLTEAGKKLSVAYDEISARLNNIEMEFSQMQGALKGKLKVAVVSTAKYFMPALLGKFHKNFPHVDIQLKVTNREEIIERLRNNMDDIVIMSQLPEKLPIIAKSILDDALVIAASPHHPLAKKKKISLKELADEPFIIREPGSGTRMVMEKIFLKNRMKPKIVMELGSASAIKQAIIAGLGLSIVSQLSLENELALKKLVVLDVIHFPVKHKWYAVYAKGKVLSPIAANFYKFLEEQTKNSSV